MLKPTKFSHPDRTVLVVSATILDKIYRKRLIKFDDLYALIGKQKQGIEALFLPSINLLYLLGLVEYRKKTDSFEYIG